MADIGGRTGAHALPHNERMVQDEPAWAFEFAVDCKVTLEFAWNFWTNVKNWAFDSDIESVELDGPFATGTRGLTHSTRVGRIEWRIVEVRPGKAVIEFPLSGAAGQFVWTFEDVAGCTRITQRCTLQGEQADIYAKAFGPDLEAGIPVGLTKLCRMMQDADGLDQPSPFGG